MKNESSPSIRALKAELSNAIRRDHARRLRHRKILRLGGASVLGVAALSSAALAATGAFHTVETVTPVGEVELAQNVTIQGVDSYPEFRPDPSHEFSTSNSGAAGARFIYHVTGGEAREIGCGPTDPHPSNNIYITSTQPLSEQEIRKQLRPDGELEGHIKPPKWITSESNGCPNPGIAGQPGTPNGPLVAGKAAVSVPTSTKTSILIRKKTLVPVTPQRESGTRSTTTTPSDTATMPSSAPTPSGTTTSSSTATTPTSSPSEVPTSTTETTTSTSVKAD